MKRADRCRLQRPEHHAPPLDFMPRGELSAAKVSNSLAELTGRLFGKGQGDQGTKRATLLALDLAPVPLGQDKSLATTCAGPQGHAGLCHFKSVKLFSSQPRGGVLGIIHDTGPGTAASKHPMSFSSRSRSSLASLTSTAA